MTEASLLSGVSRVAVFGPGLLGGSIAMALRRRLPAVEVRLWARRPEALERALALGVCDAADTDPARVARSADLVVLATPIEAMRDVLGRAASGLSEGAVVTDVGSVKRPVMEALAPVCAGAGAHFVGSHPMAGSENGGIEHADPGLFEDAVCIVTPPEPDAGGESVGGRPVGAAVERVRGFWSGLGCRVVSMDAAAHDLVVGRISHLPHVAASAVVTAALGSDPDAARFIGPGFRDTTRVAAGDADLWTGILMANAGSVVEPLRQAARELERAADLIERGEASELRQFLDRARKLRQSCAPRTPGPAASD